MGEYLKDLMNKRKDLELKLKRYNDIVDAYFGTKEYFKVKHYYFNKTKQLQKELKQVKKKIEFVIGIKRQMNG